MTSDRAEFFLDEYFREKTQRIRAKFKKKFPRDYIFSSD